MPSIPTGLTSADNVLNNLHTPAAGLPVPTDTVSSPGISESSVLAVTIRGAMAAINPDSLFVLGPNTSTPQAAPFHDAKLAIEMPTARGTMTVAARFPPETPQGAHHDSHSRLRPPFSHTLHEHVEMPASDIQGSLNHVLLEITRLTAEGI